MQQFVGQAVRDYKLQNACNCDQKLVVIGIAALGLIANREAITNGSISVATAVSEVVDLPMRLRVRFLLSLC